MLASGQDQVCVCGGGGGGSKLINGEKTSFVRFSTYG